MAIQYARNNASSGHLPGMLEFLVTPTFRIPPAPPASHNETRYLRIRSRTETDHQSDLARIFLGRILVRRRPINTLRWLIQTSFIRLLFEAPDPSLRSEAEASSTLVRLIESVGLKQDGIQVSLKLPIPSDEGRDAATPKELALADR